MTLPMKKKSCAGRIRRVSVVQSAALRGIVAEAFVGEEDVLGGEDFGEEKPTPRTTSMVVRMTESARSPPSSSPASR